MHVNVKRSELLEKLKANREEHRGLYEEAVENYRKALIEELNGWIDQIKEGKVIRIFSALPIPEIHLDEYDSAIALLEHGVDEVVELDEHEAAELLAGQWHWKASFAANTMRYSTPR